MGIVAAVVVAALVAAPAPALAAAEPAYAFTLRAAAIEPYARAAAEFPIGVGFSSVDLIPGSPVCEAVGAGYWLGVYEDRGLVFDGSMPHRGEGPAGSNPTAARVFRPAPNGPGEDRAPAFAADGASGPRWTARCEQDGTAGRATGVGLDGPVRVAGSTTSAGVEAGTYTGTARAYVQGLGPSTGALDSFASAFSVTVAPGAEPEFTYRITLFRADPGSGERSELGPSAVTLAGEAVPAGELAARFARQAAVSAAGVARLAALGVRLLPPDVSAVGGRTSVSAPAFVIGAGLAGRRNLAGQEQGLRLGSVTFVRAT